ncbi:MAG: autotransporter outer membrane beta-barrel domain-containing protein [Elusimicrobiaceae bacterium]|nr:autotransporter outer membrane beta-barrel domain-containing protein [Elusimicrobiaceae bacterium]
MSTHHETENIYESEVVQALEQIYCSSCSAAVVSSCLVSSHGLGARVVSRIYDGGRKAVYTATATAMLLQNMAPAAQAAESSAVVSSGQIATGLVMPDGDVSLLKVLSGGTTIDTVLNSTGSEYVSNGGSDVNITINSGAEQRVYGGGVATGATINGGGTQTLSGTSSGGTALDTVINGGLQKVTKYGVASNTHILEGGGQNIWNNGSAIGTTIEMGAIQRVSNGGSAINTTVGGVQSVLANGFARDTTILSGGVQSAKGIVSNTTIQEGGQQKVYTGGMVTDTHILSGGNQYLYVNASAQNTILDPGAKQAISSGGTANNTIVNSGATQEIYHNGSSLDVNQMSGGNINLRLSGGATTFVTGTNQNGEALSVSDGVATNFIVNEGGYQYVLSGASAVNTLVNSGGIQKLSGSGIGGGTALNTVINSGGSQTVNSGGTASNTTVNSGGFQGVYGSGVASDTQVLAGGRMGVSSGGASANNTVVASQGAMSIGHGASATDITIQSGGVMGIVVRGGEGTYITGSHEGRGTFLLSDGVASNFVISSYDNGIYGVFGVSSGGEALDTLLIGESARQSVQNGGVVSNTTMSGGNLTIRDGGVVDTVTAYGGKIGVDADIPVQILGNATLSGTLVNLAVVSSASMATLGSRSLSIENLSANGATFNMNVDLENQTGDQLTVQSSYSGNAQIAVTNIGSSAQETTDDGIKLVEFSDPSNASGTFGLAGGRYEEGAYVYGLAQGTKAGEGKDYYLRSIDYAPIFKTMLNVPVMNVMVAQTGMNSLQRRLGDLRNMDNTDKRHGIWVRSYYRDVTVDDLAKTDLKLFGAEAGYDWLFRAEEPTKLYAGVLIGYVNLNSMETHRENGSYEKGDGETPSAGVYATLVNEEGWFVDLAARNFWTKLDLTSHNGSTPSPTYSPKRNVVAVSTEAGTNFVSSLSRNKFIRIEPKAEVAWMNAASGDTPVHNGVGDLHYEEMNYLSGKAGVLLSYNTKYGNDLLIEPLVELAYRYEFDGKGNVSYGGATEKSDLSGGSLEVNAGLNMQLTKDLYWYALGSYENGKKIEGWGVYAGVRYKFGGEDTTLPPGAVVQTQTAADKPATQKDQAALPKAGPEEVFHLLFKFGSDALEPAAVDAVRNFAKLYVSGKQTAPILLEGYTCDLGKPAYNKVLSRRRAEAVQKILIQQGISKDKITVKAYGDTQFVKKGFGGRKDYRRVVVSVYEKRK